MAAGHLLKVLLMRVQNFQIWDRFYMAGFEWQRPTLRRWVVKKSSTRCEWLLKRIKQKSTWQIAAAVVPGFVC